MKFALIAAALIIGEGSVSAEGVTGAERQADIAKMNSRPLAEKCEGAGKTASMLVHDHHTGDTMRKGIFDLGREEAAKGRSGFLDHIGRIYGLPIPPTAEGQKKQREDEGARTRIRCLINGERSNDPDPSYTEKAPTS
ncbi:hypothetical protein C1J03_13005 [Sulfitobacter sp. SK012]|uniref:hypothetical protein n=1 Tax=Sulfitobacter sp. SK012 TaxID=1389005 RepID=UPI000E0B4682|nr:hypothetical protein [Sulfitobacter sp. SK012]AXI46860.1 hypothetical protein C1J03_13005 [Sulfitobacter sp. SK012]